MKTPRSGGGWRAIRYTLKKAREVGGFFKLYRALRSKNACKTCALGMGGQRGGMVNEQGHFPEVCKKSLQAMAADMQGGIKSEFWSTYSIEQLKKFSPFDMEHCGRLTEPVVLDAGEQYYRPIRWDDALAMISDKLRSTSPDETFWYFSGRSSNEAGFLLQLFARLYGTNHVNNCSYYCHQASGVGLQSSIGSGTATVVLDDLNKTDLVFLIGGNPASNHPRLMTSLMKVRRRGGQVIVINPVVETGLVNFRVPSDVRSLLFGSQIASTYVQPHIGGDLALLTGIAKAVDELELADYNFLSTYCDDSSAFLEHLRALTWDEIVGKSGVGHEEISEVARQFGKSKYSIFAWAMGITHHEHGVENVQAIANLAMIRGMVGKPHAGLMPIRGHSNVQGIGSVGVTPKLKDEVFRRLEVDLGVKLPTTPGLDTLGCMLAADEGRLHVGFCLGGNLYGSNPDADFAERALGKLDLLVYLNTSLNTGHARGLARQTLILPVLARDEEPYRTTQESMFNFVRFSDGGKPRQVGPRGEVHVIADVAARVLGDSTPVDWTAMQEPANIRKRIAAAIPGFEKLEEIDETNEEFQIEGRTFHTPHFPTSSGRAKLHCHALPPLKGQSGQYRLMTVRSEGQFNTVVYEIEDLYRGQERRDVILIHPHDMQQLGLKHNQPVRVWNEIGELQPVLAREFDRIKPGNVLMYYPEANVLVPRVADPKSMTPSFKNVLIAISAISEPSTTRPKPITPTRPGD
ncbi:MAG TPA: FdhF/YdeP family oxidoreductase [Pirellulaceae bacterium]|nr:FdhF/YdeP family oxidoreductase [Pirellulaceae bacterium]